MATAEFAVALPAVVVVLVVGLTAIGTSIDQVRCVDAARLAARSLARGDSQSSARALASQAAPAGSLVALTAGDRMVTATVTVSRQAPVLGLTWVVRGQASAPQEGVPP